MANLQLSLACSDNPRTRPIIDGLVKPDGIDLHVTVVHPSEMFWRQLHFQEFDLSEMSMSSLIMAVEHGDTRWVGIPIFTSRRFFHAGVLVRSDSGIEKPEDLKGKRIAIPGRMTSSYLALKLLHPDFIPVDTHFDKILDVVKEGSVDAGLIIHEAQLTYAKSGFHNVVDWTEGPCFGGATLA